MKFKKAHNNWNIASNSEQVTLYQEDDLQIAFELDAEAFEHIDKGEKGKLLFPFVYGYSTKIDDKISQELENQTLKHGFYIVSNSNWQAATPKDFFYIDDKLSKKKLKHYILYSQQNFIQIIAENFEFEFLNNSKDEAYKKYPKGYFSHFLAMYCMQYKEPSIEQYKTFIQLYFQIESKESFRELQNEIKTIQKEDNLPLFLKVLNNYGMQNFRMKQLLKLIQIIQSTKI